MEVVDDSNGAILEALDSSFKKVATSTASAMQEIRDQVRLLLPE